MQDQLNANATPNQAIYAADATDSYLVVDAHNPADDLRSVCPLLVVASLFPIVISQICYSQRKKDWVKVLLPATERLKVLRNWVLSG